jgi:hypothetical protein
LRGILKPAGKLMIQIAPLGGGIAPQSLDSGALGPSGESAQPLSG